MPRLGNCVGLTATPYITNPTIQVSDLGSFSYLTTTFYGREYGPNVG